mgnify:CR=1 FL=1
MKKNVKFLLPLVIGSFVMTGCGGAPKAETDIKDIVSNSIPHAKYLEIQNLNMTVEVEKTKQIDITSLPQSVAQKGVEFESKDTEVATVDENGVITGVQLGNTIVEVKTKDGSFSTPINVYVTGEVEEATLATLLDSLKAQYESPTLPTKFREVEYSEESYYKNGQYDHGYKSMEIIDYDSVNGYFMVSSDDIYIKTQNGAMEKLSGKWVFGALSDYAFRMCHITKTASTYLDMTIPDSLLITDNPKNSSVLSILDMFFVAGREIVTDQQGYMAGNKDFSQIYDEAQDDISGFTQFGDNTFSYKAVDTWQNQVTTGADELLHNSEIPEGTLTNDTQTIEFFYDGASCPGINITVKSDYNLNGSEMERIFTRNMLFQTDFTPESCIDPDIKLEDFGFTEVKTIYEL